MRIDMCYIRLAKWGSDRAATSPAISRFTFMGSSLLSANVSPPNTAADDLPRSVDIRIVRTSAQPAHARAPRADTELSSAGANAAKRRWETRQ